jgi:mRNA interferase RelE/StbE
MFVLTEQTYDVIYGISTVLVILTGGWKVEIKYTKLAVKAINDLNKRTQQRIKKGIEEIPDGDIIALKGKDNIYRLRIGKYRVLFRYEEKIEQKIICVIDIGSRGDIYK